MLVENQLVEVKIIGKTLKHYRDLGYDVECGDIIIVPPIHLTKGSHTEVSIICDICGKNIFREYKQYLAYHTDGYDTCNKCKDKKAKTTCIEKYGVETHMLIPEIQQKCKNTVLNKYGVENISQADTIKNKKKQTCIKNYGVENPMFSDVLKEKLEKTNIEKYGCKNPQQNKEIHRKTELTNIKKYGAKSPMQNLQIKEKAMQTLYSNNVIPTSSQQFKLYETLKAKYENAILNYPFSTCFLDIFICINNIKIDIEYDGGYWHKNQQQDIKRDKFLQSQGFKTLRIRSGHLLPTEEELFNAIDYLINTEHHFKEIILSDWKEGE